MQRIAVFLSVLILLGCEKNINFKLDNALPKIVVEATIENDQPPRVILTRSIGYFAKITPEDLSQSFIHNADIWVSGSNGTHKLKEYTIQVGQGLSFSYYSIDSSNLATAFTGELNHSYSLKIINEGQTYTSTTTIPGITRIIDSIWVKPATGGDSSKAIVMVRATDPPGFGDYIRYFTSINRGPFLPPFNSTYDDLFIDGTTYELQVQPGVDRNTGKRDENLFNKGDTVVFKISNIDKATFDFWRTMEYSYNSVGNPFSTPSKVLGNISNNALGYFGGYASQYHTLIIPK
jgi:hypothetical protein